MRCFEYEHHLMLHVRYFCFSNINNLLRTMNNLSSIPNNLNYSYETINTNFLSTPVKFEDTFKAILTSNNLQNNSIKINSNSPLNINSSTIIQDVVKENAFNFILSYLEKQTMLNYPKIAQQKVVVAPTPKTQLNKKNEASSSLPPQQQEKQHSNAFDSSSNFKTKNDLKLLGFNGSIHSAQNWCAKCNSHFRLTSDLVYHMRTFHKKEENNSDTKLILNLNENALNLIRSNNNTHLLQEPQKITSLTSKESNGLRCEICNEVFKEKHHMR
jgi:hypothetical protein